MNENLNISQHQADILNEFQKLGFVHPFTCNGTDETCYRVLSTENRENGVMVEYNDINEGILTATKDGWVCPCGKTTPHTMQSIQAINFIYEMNERKKNDVDDTTPWEIFGSFGWYKDGLVTYIKNPDGVISAYIDDTPFVVQSDSVQEAREELHACMAVFFKEFKASPK